MAFVVVNPRLKNAMEIFEKGIEEQVTVGVKWTLLHGIDGFGTFASMCFRVLFIL